MVILLNCLDHLFRNAVESGQKDGGWASIDGSNKKQVADVLKTYINHSAQRLPIVHFDIFWFHMLGQIAKETMIYYDFPSKFVPRGHGGKRQKTTRYYDADETIKEACKTTLTDAWILTILYIHWRDHKVEVPKIMLRDNIDFTELDDERLRFDALFVFTGDAGDVLSVDRVKSIVQGAGICASAIKYGKWLKSEGCKRVKGNRQWAWTGIVVPERG